VSDNHECKCKSGKSTSIYLSFNGVEASTFARDGNIGYRDANNKIKIYATKNSGKDIVVKSSCIDCSVINRVAIQSTGDP